MKGVARLVRVLSLGGASAFLGLGAHLAGGGAVPGPGLLALLVVLLGLIAVSATRRRLRLPVLLALLGVEQLGLHAALASAGPAPGVPLHTMPSGGHTMASPSMLTTHVIATVLTAWLLARGEAWLCGLRDELGAALVGPKGRRCRRRVEADPSIPAGVVARVLRHDALRRGPPPVEA